MNQQVFKAKKKSSAGWTQAAEKKGRCTQGKIPRLREEHRRDEGRDGGGFGQCLF